METNFTMETHKQDNALHIDMKGTFDGASAFALIQKIEKEIYDNKNSVYVDTKDISKVYPFGRAILSSNMPKTCRKCVCFRGAMADRIAPEGCTIEHRTLHQSCRQCTGDCKNCQCNTSRKINIQPTIYQNLKMVSQNNPQGGCCRTNSSAL